MADRIRSRLTYANVMSTLAVFLLLGGGAWAVQKIGSKNIKKNAVRSKHIKKNQVKSPDIKDGTVRAKDVKDGTIGAADLEPDGDFVEPNLRSGGQGDCLWHSLEDLTFAGSTPAGYRQDRFGVVQFYGAVISTETTGIGDEECGATGPEPDDSIEDGIAFVLPPALRPQHTVIDVVTEARGVFVVGVEPLMIGPSAVAPGSVLVSTPPTSAVSLNGVSFPTAASGVFPAAAGSVADNRISKRDFKRLLGP